MTKKDLIQALERFEDSQHIWMVCPFSGDPFPFEVNWRGGELLLERDEEALEVPVMVYELDSDSWSIDIVKKEEKPVEEEF